MRFTLQREAFLKPLAQVVNVVERRQTLPVLANFLVQVQNGQLSLTGTDLEVEMVSRIAVEDAQDGETTIPARKLFEIIRACPTAAGSPSRRPVTRSPCRPAAAASPWPPCPPTTSRRWTKWKPPSAWPSAKRP
jgi:hypothetical protein